MFGKPCHLVPAHVDIPAGTTAIFCGTAPELINPVSWLHFSYSALHFRIWPSEKSDWGQLYSGRRNAPNPWFCDRATEIYLHRFQQHPTHHVLFYLDWDQQLKLQFLVLFRCSCWTFSQGSSFLSLHIDGWPGTRLMGKYLRSFLFYSRVNLFFQVSTIPHQLSQATDWCQ